MPAACRAMASPARDGSMRTPQRTGGYAFRPVLSAALAAAALAARAPAAPDIPAAAEAVDRARTKVVVLKTERKSGRASATGFLARAGMVVTAEHAAAGTTGISAWLNGVRYGARLLERHPEHDLALLQLRAPRLHVKPLEMARDSADLVAHEELVILAGPSQGPEANGDPAARLAIPARFRGRPPLRDPAGRLTTMLSLQASIRRGDSGSPVLRLRDGALVGVISSRELPDAAGVSHHAYAVPVEALHPWLEDAARRAERQEEFYLFRR
jgi:S1-C subfamily serine protease